MDLYRLRATPRSCDGCHQPIRAVSYTVVIDGDIVSNGILQWAPGMAGYVATPSLVRWLKPDSGGELLLRCANCEQPVRLVAGPGLFHPDVSHILVWPEEPSS